MTDIFAEKTCFLWLPPSQSLVPRFSPSISVRCNFIGCWSFSEPIRFHTIVAYGWDIPGFEGCFAWFWVICIIFPALSWSGRIFSRCFPSRVGTLTKWVVHCLAFIMVIMDPGVKACIIIITTSKPPYPPVSPCRLPLSLLDFGNLTSTTRMIPTLKQWAILRGIQAMSHQPSILHVLVGIIQPC